MSSVRVRAFTVSDAPQLAEIYFAAVHGIASAHYAPEQIRAWAPRIPDAARFLARATDGRATFVAVDEADRPIAYGDLEGDGHIDHFYCLPEHAGTGVAASVYRELERAAVAARMARLYVEASEPAARFFAKRGFTLESRNDFEINGVPIHNYRMTKQIA